MIYLFPLSIVGSLSQLEKLDISNCQVMEEIFKKGEEGMEITTSDIKFPKLCDLRLRNLPSLCGFCKGVDRIEVPTLHNLTISNVPSMMKDGDSNVYQQLFFNQQVCFLILTI